MYKHDVIPIMTMKTLVNNLNLISLLYRNIQGKIKAKCNGLEIKFGTNPEKIR